ncbi:MAG: hypothetical protein ACRDNE_00625 [Gaiellaceae bacterium]
MAADPLAAVIRFLKADTAVQARTSGRVFGGELPKTEITSMPRVAVLLRPAGGGLIGRAYQGYGDKRVDIDCYGSTPNEGWLLHLDVAAALKDLRHEVHADVLLHWARASSDGMTARDPKTDWPLTYSSWQVLISPVPVPT